jgi:hypothetical protein
MTGFTNSLRGREKIAKWKRTRKGAYGRCSDVHGLDPDTALRKSDISQNMRETSIDNAFHRARRKDAPFCSTHRRKPMMRRREWRE